MGPGWLAAPLRAPMAVELSDARAHHHGRAEDSFPALSARS